jgi:enoyl-[acyl-carrier protein] reductase II
VNYSPFPEHRLSDLFHVEYPIVQAGMVWASGAKLAAAMSNAGGLGLIGSGSMKPELLREHIQKARSLTDKPFGVNIPLLRGDADELVQVVLDEEVPVVFSSAGSPKKYTPALKEAGRVVVHVVPTVKFAKKVQEAGCDAVVAEGFEAGGHNGIDMVTTMALIPQVADAVSIPVIAAGGIVDGRGIAAAIALGASGVQMGTRFAATVESSAHENYKQAIVEATDTSTTFGLLKIGPARMIANSWTERVRAAEAGGATPDELREILGEKRERLGIFEGDLDEGQVEAGQGAGMVRTIPTVAELMEQLIEEYIGVINRMRLPLRGPEMERRDF